MRTGKSRTANQPNPGVFANAKFPNKISVTKRRQEALIESALRGEGGEKENAQSICAKLGIEWNQRTVPPNPQSSDDGTRGWHSISYGLILEWKTVHSALYAAYKPLAEMFTKQVIAEKTGCLNVYKDDSLGANVLFWGTEEESKLVQDILWQQLPEMIDRVQKSYSGYIYESNLHFQGAQAAYTPNLKGAQYKTIFSKPEEIV